jgi:predicted RNA binding protein YcfA (HicA-like mRNA interferase family)
MTKLPVVDFRAMDRLLRKMGFQQIRQKGSHVFYRHPDGRTTTVPHHSSQVLGRPLVHAILEDIRITPEEFSDLLNQ